MTDLFKDDPSVGDVHVSSAGGSKRKPRKKPGKVATTVDTGKFDKAQVVKVDDELGLVFGFAIVCKQNGQDYFDLQDDHITEKAMLDASTDFMVNSRIAKEMHEGDAAGSVVFAFPLTTDIAKSLDIVTKQTGLLIAMKPGADMLAKFKDGTLTGFSIGGSRGKDEVVE